MRAVFLVVALGALGCDGDPAGLPDLSVVTVDIEPGDAELAVGDTLRLTALPRTADGTALGSVGVEWEVDGPVETSVLHGGYVLRVKALEPGEVAITATSEGKSGHTTLTVTPGPVDVVTIDPDSLVLEEGAGRHLFATARDANGYVVSDRFVQWMSSDPSVAHVDPLGLVRAIRTGTVEVSARVDGRSATATVRVFADYAYDLLYTAWSDPSTPAIFRLDIRDPAGEPARIIPESAKGGSPAASPDGERIAFTGTSPDHGTGIFVMNRDGSDLVLIDPMVTPYCGQVAWSPDGLTLAYMCQVPGTDADIVTIDADGENRRVLTEGDAGSHMWPTWSPAREDGGYRIAYSRVVDGTPRIWTMKSDGTDRRQLTSGYDDQPAWSPDGSTIVFQRIGTGIFADLYLVDADGTDVRPLITGALAGPQDHPKWSPDGTLIAFASRHETYGQGTGATQIYTVWRDGTKLARRTAGDQEKFGAAWLRR